VNIFRKKSRKKIVVLLLLCLFANYFISPLYVFAGSYLTDIESKISEIDLAFTNSESLNDSSSIEESCAGNRYCQLATAKIKQDLQTKKSEYESVKGEIKLSDLVAIVGSPSGYEHLTTENKDSVVNYQTLIEISNEYVSSMATCHVGEDPVIAQDEEACTALSGTWTPAVVETATVTVDNLEAKILDYLSSVLLMLDDYDSESFQTKLGEAEEGFRLQDETDATTAKTNLLNDITITKTSINTSLGLLETFLADHSPLDLSALTEEELNTYLSIKKDIYNLYNTMTDITTDYNNLVNNENYQLALTDEWDNFKEEVITNYDELLLIFTTNGTQEEELIDINDATDIDNLDDELVADEEFLVAFLSNIRTNLTMVNSDNLDKITEALLDIYVLSSSNNNVVVNHEDKSIIISNVLTLSKEDFESYLSVSSEGTFAGSNYYELVMVPVNPELEEETSYLVKTSTIVKVFTKTEVLVGEYTVSLVGDANCDSTIDLLDLQILEALVLGNTATTDYTDAVLNALDYNLDLEYNISDIVMLYGALNPSDVGIEG